MARKATARKPAAKKVAGPTFAVRSVHLKFNLEQFGPDGKLLGVQEIPAMLFEAQFNETVASLAAALLEQANKSPEPTAKGEGKKEE
jgi:hypothetical protein